MPRARKAKKRKTKAKSSDSLSAQIIADMLVWAEQNGVLRSVLKGATAALRKAEKKAVPGSNGERRLQGKRQAIADHLVGLLRGLDASTKAEILRDIIFDLCLQGSKEVEQKAEDQGVSFQSDEHAPWAILLTVRHAVWACCKLAQEGNDDLAGELPIYAIELVEAVNKIARERPESIRAVAAERVDWPVLMARHYPKASDFAKLADRIGLATDNPVTPNKSQKWKPQTPVNRFLLSFFGGLVLTKQEAYFRRTGFDWPKLTTKTIPTWLDEIIMPSLDHIRENEGSWEGIPAIAAITKQIPYEAEHRKAVRNRIKAALEGLARNVGH